VIHQLSALPKDGPRRASDLEATNRLRVNGTRNLLNAAINARARRFVVGSFAMLSPRGTIDAPAGNEAAAAVQSMESQVLEATTRGSIEGVILRYGMFYGLESPSTVRMIQMVRKRLLPVVSGDMGQLPLIHVDDAVSATLSALDLAAASRSTPPFRVPAWLPRLVTPYMARFTAFRMPLSNARAKAELGWQPKYSTMRDGLAEMLRHAA
jgi:nucleoside-diphosphate-sugar epimerase